MHHLRGRRIFERVLVTLSWRVARHLEQALGTRRLQPQLQLLVCTALLVGITPLYTRGLGPGGAPHTTFDLSFAVLWAVGVACALGAAYQTKFHRLAALILLGGAGLVTCISFLWLSAPDLALTQLIVETVTTVLILLGLRWLPPRYPHWRRPLGLRAASGDVAGRDLAIPSCRSRAWQRLLCGHGPSGAGQHCGDFFL